MSESDLPTEPIDRFTKPFARFLRIEAGAGIILLLVTICAIVLSNSVLSEPFLAFWETQIGLRLGDVDGFDLIRQIKTIHPPTRILVISMHGEDMYAERSLAAGAVGYIMKSEPPERILEALSEICEGRIYVSRRISMQVLNRVKYPRAEIGSGIKSLTDRELQIFHLIGLGYQTRQIAQRLGIGVKTVETHRENIKTKLGLEHAVALVREATVWVRRER